MAIVVQFARIFVCMDLTWPSYLGILHGAIQWGCEEDPYADASMIDSV